MTVSMNLMTWLRMMLTKRMRLGIVLLPTHDDRDDDDDDDDTNGQKQILIPSA